MPTDYDELVARRTAERLRSAHEGARRRRAPRCQLSVQLRLLVRAIAADAVSACGGDLDSLRREVEAVGWLRPTDDGMVASLMAGRAFEVADAVEILRLAEEDPERLNELMARAQQRPLEVRRHSQGWRFEEAVLRRARQIVVPLAPARRSSGCGVRSRRRERRSSRSSRAGPRASPSDLAGDSEPPPHAGAVACSSREGW